MWKKHLKNFWVSFTPLNTLVVNIREENITEAKFSLAGDSLKAAGLDKILL